MSPPDNKTRFLLNLPGFTVELVGRRKFVEDLYRKISRDLAPILAAAAEGSDAAASEPGQTQGLHRASTSASDNQYARVSGYTWVYLCTHLFNKVYVVDSATVETTIVGRYVDAERLRRVYLDKDETALFTGLTSGNRTLWAEFTTEGRQMLRDALEQTRANQAQTGAQRSSE